MAPRKFEFDLTPTQRKNVKKWVKELESGKYRQAKGRLAKQLSKTEKGYCCLGVANEVFQMDEPEYEGDLCGMRSVEPTLGLTSDFETYLQGLNDKGKKPFSYIANRIRKHMLGETVPNVR